MRTFRNIFVGVAFFLFFCFSATSGFASDFDNQIIFGDSSPVIMDGTSDNVLNWESFNIGVRGGRTYGCDDASIENDFTCHSSEFLGGSL